MGWQEHKEWENQLDETCEKYLKSIKGEPQSLSFFVEDTTGCVVRRFKYDDPISISVRSQNCKEHDRIRKILARKCPYCGYVLSSDIKNSFQADGQDCCSLCHYMHNAVNFNAGLKNFSYFREIQAEYEKKKNDDGRRGGWRDRAGL